MLIDYRKIVTALEFYEREGFKRVEVPWLVGYEAMQTCPRERLQSVGGYPRREYLIGSAEQGFLELKLPKGRYCAVSPCFRVEDSYQSGIRQRHFMKVELIESFPQYLNVSARQMMWAALRCFRFLGMGMEYSIQHTEEGADIMYRGTELGSYGFRRGVEYEWAYGTGLAEPRFSVVVSG